jgi:hypothetical protein
VRKLYKSVIIVASIAVGLILLGVSALIFGMRTSPYIGEIQINSFGNAALLGAYPVELALVENTLSASGLELRLSNNSADGNVLFGERFDIQVFNRRSGQWDYVDMRVGFLAIGFTLWPYSERPYDPRYIEDLEQWGFSAGAVEGAAYVARHICFNTYFGSPLRRGRYRLSKTIIYLPTGQTSGGHSLQFFLEFRL